MRFCNKKIIKIVDETGEKVTQTVPELDNVRVKINPNPKDDSEYYIVLD